MADWSIVDRLAVATLLRLRDARLLKNFYLTGGTGLAVHLGHRTSVDLDFFTEQPVSEISTVKLQAACRKLGRTETVFRTSDQLWLRIDEVKVTFLAFPYAHKYPIISEDGIPLADARDIALQKALAIGQRATARDYVDLAWILRKGVLTLEQIVKDSSEIFAAYFSPRLFLQQLAYTDDLKDKEAAINSLRSPENFADLAGELSNAIHLSAKKLLM